MAKSETPKYPYWNGKNLNGKDQVGNKALIAEGPKSVASSKYEVSDETQAITSQDLE